MFVSHIDDNGDVYLQNSKKISIFIETFISIKMRNAKYPTSKGQKVSLNKIYVTQ